MFRIMESRALAFCLGAVAGLTGSVGVFKLRPQTLQREDTEQERVDIQNTNTDESIQAEMFRYGYPEPKISTHTYTAHSLAYDRSKKIPVWVCETITSDMIQSRVANRKRSQFQSDPMVPQCYCSSNEDYRRSGWSRGHMAPAGNYKHCQNSMDDTFYLTNIVPQDLDNNSGYWNSIEDYCRKLAKRYPNVNIISGPLFLPETDPSNEKKFVKYEVIGKSNVAVPTHLYKIILADNGTSGPPVMGVFVVPNRPIKDVNLTRFQVSLEEVESYTGTTFHFKLDRSKVRDLCTTDGCKLMSIQDWAIIGYQKRVRSASNIDQLEDVWREMKGKNIRPDKRLSDLYNKRKVDLQSVDR